MSDVELINNLEFALSDKLSEVGDTVSLTGHLHDECFEVGEHELALPQGVDYDVLLTNAGDGILVTGMVRALAVGSCDRCLDEARLELSCEVNQYYLFEEPTSNEEDDEDYLLVSADKTIDLGAALLEALIMETPFVVLCKDDCKGLCPVCYQNLNEHDCGHLEQRAREAEAERLASSPFAKLKDLPFDN